MKVILYSSKTCASCHSLKKYLKFKQIEFQEKPVDHSSEWREEAIKLSGAMIMPVLVIGDSVISGFNLSAINSLLN